LGRSVETGSCSSTSTVVGGSKQALGGGRKAAGVTAIATSEIMRTDRKMERLPETIPLERRVPDVTSWVATSEKNELGEQKSVGGVEIAVGLNQANVDTVRPSICTLDNTVLLESMFLKMTRFSRVLMGTSGIRRRQFSNYFATICGIQPLNLSSRLSLPSIIEGTNVLTQDEGRLTSTTAEKMNFNDINEIGSLNSSLAVVKPLEPRQSKCIARPLSKSTRITGVVMGTSVIQGRKFSGLSARTSYDDQNYLLRHDERLPTGNSASVPLQRCVQEGSLG